MEQLIVRGTTTRDGAREDEDDEKIDGDSRTSTTEFTVNSPTHRVSI